ncbi:hypothetical protein C7S16_5699 [Burkholderia thailandensis]|uniref:Uncharacterized protein n=1 Tax=Burkholderia thailandensis TaxID=57975 RepID=A0AAW9CQ91_BURTH|nr:hypothetical protein [Burkholderia thailandensis]MDW9251253.1 hypothetical protein [Burkholderia thailandensis]
MALVEVGRLARQQRRAACAAQRVFAEAVGIEPIDREAVTADDMHIVFSSCASRRTITARDECVPISASAS